ncbi:hypothetical protein DOTSEDRAFT_164834 [Dothistroma septosporum NZE10]|uniref:Nucleolar 27S pre-rRNA processing Urb2/Npa2 C-terminal domain-containing protein n=1 Tax=Dothistroma septosporum (strain NZE10 / CBS 128990) TaxID=675120 RepID=N1Q2J1_DOTSN|nr:hypothetical protein DOTSEDRAFT_164834 [Dothistroma septosporum NZE10]
MGPPAQSERPSLDRLKALDTLPDLDAQVAEAKFLCNHAARAEMITKWLLAKLKSQDEARVNAHSWDLLSSCCQLLSPQTIAVLLGTNGFIGVLQATVATSNLNGRLLEAIRKTLLLLFELSRSAHGAAVKSLLSTASPTAATICGRWLHHVYSLAQQAPVADKSTLYECLGAILPLWTSRKPSAQDDVLFNSSCLVNALMLTSRLQSDAPMSTKRKRSGVLVNTSQEQLAALERLVAKHTILPARTAFFKTRQQQAGKSRGKGTSEEPSSIKERLSSLKMAIWAGVDREALHNVPLVLDIALRSKSTPTPRDRMNERPWLEELWAALRGCFANQERASKNQTLVALMHTLRQQGTTLSHQILADIVKEDAVPADGSSESVHWPLVARVVDLDATIFSDRALAQLLFDHITAASVSGEHDSGSDLNQTLKDDIVIPVMRAYGRSRSLRTFMDIWGDQLQQEQNFEPQSIWNDISSSFAALVEEALPQAQIMSSIHEGTSSLHEMAALSMPTLNTTLVTLEALLRGVRADSAVIKLQDELGTLLRDLFTITELEAFEVHKNLPVQLWRLLSRVVTLWYPLWASKQQDQNAIGDKGAALLARKTFKIALKQATVVDAAFNSTELIAEAARTFVATMCSFFKDVEHQKCNESCAEAIDTLGKQHICALDTFIGHPKILANIEPTKRKELFSNAFGANSAVDQISATIAASRSNDGRAVLDDILRAVKQGPKQQQLDESIMSPIVAVGGASFTRAHRVELLDIINKMDDSKANELPGILAMMLKLASPPCLEAKLFDDASSLWKILAVFGKHDDSIADISVSVDLLERVVDCVLKAWLSTQQRQRTRQLLAEFSAKLAEHMHQTSSTQENSLSANRAAIAVVKTAVGVLESDSAAVVSKELTHRETKHLKAYIGRLLEDADSILTSIEQDGKKFADYSTAKLLQSVLEALSCAPESVWQLSGQFTKAGDAARRLAAILDSQITEDGSVNITEGTAIACVRAASNFLHNDTVKLTALAHKALQHNLGAVEYRSVLAEYETCLKNVDHVEKLQALSQFKADANLISMQSLALQRVALRSLTAEDVEADKARLTATFHDMLEAAANSHDAHIQRAALVTVAETAKEKPSVVNQYAVEHTISVMVRLLKSSSNTGAIYASICNILIVLFAHHRSRLRGRFHLVIALLQSLLSGLSHKTIGSNGASIRHARALSKLLETFCNPPQAWHSKKSSHLVDEARKAQAHAGQFAQYLLHHYCSQILIGTLGEGVRDALSPGLWAVIEAIEVHNADGIKSLSAAMNNSERAVLRSVYDDWKRFGKWEGT